MLGFRLKKNWGLNKKGRKGPRLLLANLEFVKRSRADLTT
jgi:hypothetical protein